MSFILDALRKSESERRRTAAPMLAGVPVEVSRPAVPVWMWIVIGVLAVAVVVLGGAWWTSARTTLTSTAIATAPAQNGPATAAATGRAPDTSTAPVPALPTAAGSGSPSQASGASDRSSAPAAALPAPAAAVASASSPTAAEAAPAAALTVPPVAAGRDVVPAATAATTTATSTTTGAEPPIDAQSGAASSASRHESLPTVAEARAAGVDLPPLTIELHVYHAQPASRWVYINGARYTEGRQLAAGPALVEIVPEGVVIADAGREFLLLAQ